MKDVNNSKPTVQRLPAVKCKMFPTCRRRFQLEIAPRSRMENPGRSHVSCCFCLPRPYLLKTRPFCLRTTNSNVVPGHRALVRRHSLSPSLVGKGYKYLRNLLKNKNNPVSECVCYKQNLSPADLPAIVVQQGTQKRVKSEQSKNRTCCRVAIAYRCRWLPPEKIKNTFDIIKPFITILAWGGEAGVLAISAIPRHLYRLSRPTKQHLQPHQTHTRHAVGLSTRTPHRLEVLLKVE